MRPASSEVAERTTAETEWAAIEHLGSGTYGNFTTSTGPGWVSTMYPPAWDPSNLFSRNHNVVPD